MKDFIKQLSNTNLELELFLGSNDFEQHEIYLQDYTIRCDVFVEVSEYGNDLQIYDVVVFDEDGRQDLDGSDIEQMEAIMREILIEK